MTAEFQPGGVVDVTIKGARIVAHPDPGLIVPIGEHRPDRPSVVLNTSEADITITLRAPAEWPPHQGDVWEDRDGDSYLALDDLRLLDRYGDARPASYVAEQFGPMRLAYRRRREPDGGDQT